VPSGWPCYLVDDLCVLLVTRMIFAEDLQYVSGRCHAIYNIYVPGDCPKLSRRASMYLVSVPCYPVSYLCTW
jgi:hypothetical protein